MFLDFLGGNEQPIPLVSFPLVHKIQNSLHFGCFYSLQLQVCFSGKHFCWIAAVDTLALLELQEPPAAAPRQVDRRFSPGHGCDDPSGGLGVRTNSVDLRLTRPLASVNLSHSLGDLHICH